MYSQLEQLGRSKHTYNLQRSHIHSPNLSTTRAKTTNSSHIAVSKTMSDPNGERFEVSRPLSFQKCAAYTSKLGPIPCIGPFEPYWNSLMLEASTFGLELREVWQIVLTTIPRKLVSNSRRVTEWHNN